MILKIMHLNNYHENAAPIKYTSINNSFTQQSHSYAAEPTEESLMQ